MEQCKSFKKGIALSNCTIFLQILQATLANLALKIKSNNFFAKNHCLFFDFVINYTRALVLMRQTLHCQMQCQRPKGGKVMNKYELLLILSASNEEGDRDAILEKISKLLESKGATITNVDKWGNKKLAYPINFKTDGYFALVNFEAPANVPAQVQLQLNIMTDVYRAMFVKKK